jgi:glutaredoxin 3
MNPVRIYTTPNCVFCDRAKSLLDRLDLDYEQMLCTDFSDLPGNLKTFPQIYFGKEHIGGCTELFELQRQGRLLSYVKQTPKNKTVVV